MHWTRPLASVSLLAALHSGGATAQQLQLFPTGPYLANCRGPETAIHLGGDDDYYNVWYFEVDIALLPPNGTSAPDFYIWLFDGDCNPQPNAGGTNDFLGGSTQRTAFEYRLYGGLNASAPEERAATIGHPEAFLGTVLDIDADPNDSTLRTDDPDDIDGNSPEDLRDQGYSRIDIDMDSQLGELVGGQRIYKLVVDARPSIGNLAGTANNAGDDRNRYKLLATRDAGRTDARGIQMMTYEYSIAGRPVNSETDANIGFFVPDTVDGRIDLQTLDLDNQVPAVGNVTSRLATPNQLFLDSATFESGEQNVGGQWRWSSIMQGTPPPSVAVGNGRRSTATQDFTLPTGGQVGNVWVYTVNPVTADNPFSFRIAGSVAQGGGWLPIRLTSVFDEYGDGPLRHYGAGLPMAMPNVADEITLMAENATPGTLGAVVMGFNRVDVPVPSLGLWRYVSSTPPLPEPTLFILFSTNGTWRYDMDIPIGIGGFTFYTQAFQLNDAAGAFSPRHSNGVKISL